MTVPSIHQVFGDGPICKYADFYCAVVGKIEPVCGLVKGGHLLCLYKCEKYKPRRKDGDAPSG